MAKTEKTLAYIEILKILDTNLTYEYNLCLTEKGENMAGFSPHKYCSYFPVQIKY